MSDPLEKSTYVIFGGTGDLARRKLLPALAKLRSRGLLNHDHQVLAVAREELDDEQYRELARETLAAAGLSRDACASFCSNTLHYHGIGDATLDDFRAIGERLQSLEGKHGGPSNRAFYLALPPQVFVSTIDRLGEAGLNTSTGWTRIVVEKPCGRDLESARELNRRIHRWYDETQIYRIDHYLGKETVQNLLVLRFANTIFESSWNRDRIEAVQITVAEDLGVGTRAGYYDRSGAIRDMLQNHLTQLFALVAMEIPSAYDAESIRHEKIKVLRSTRAIDPTKVVRGRYVAGSLGSETVPGYLDEAGVESSSQTETFVGLPLFVDNWRWAGVPFYLRTGKRMPRRMSEIAVRFRPTPAALFDSLGKKHETSDVLLIHLQPQPGFSLHCDVKVPGSPFRTDRIPLDFRYGQRFAECPEAYETLLLDVLEGDQTLFVHVEEVEQSWKLFTPLLEAETPIYDYPAGSWGPPEADDLAISDTELWRGAWSVGQ